MYDAGQYGVLSLVAFGLIVLNGAAAAIIGNPRGSDAAAPI